MISRDKKIMYDVIILVGIDGCGKSTQINLLADYFKKKGNKTKIERMRYPRGLMLGVALLAKLVGCSVYPISINREKQGIKNISNKIWLKKLLKFATYNDLKFSTWKKINRNINDENILIVDRFIVDNLVDYILATEEFSDIEKLTRKFLPLIPKKSKIIFLDIEPVTSFERRKEET